MVAHGPILEESTTDADYRQRRDRIAAMEAALEAAMRQAGYDVMNTVSCRFAVDESAFAPVRIAFAAQFPGLLLRPAAEVSAP